MTVRHRSSYHRPARSTSSTRNSADPHGRRLGEADAIAVAGAEEDFQPFVWSYAQAKGALDAAGRLINTELAERRNLICRIRPATTPRRGPSSRRIR